MFNIYLGLLLSTFRVSRGVSCRGGLAAKRIDVHIPLIVISPIILYPLSPPLSLKKVLQDALFILQYCHKSNLNLVYNTKPLFHRLNICLEKWVFLPSPPPWGGSCFLRRYNYRSLGGSHR
jgi:hypothetical protein